MGKIQLLSKKTINLSMTLGLLTTTLFSPISLLRTTPVTAETSPNTLVPGKTIDTSQKIWEAPDFQKPANFSPKGINTKGTSWPATNNYNFGTNQKDTASWLPFNGLIDMQQPITITGSTFAHASGGDYPERQLGDANGIFLTDKPSDQLTRGGTGASLGIRDLGPNTYFIGNDYAYRRNWEGHYSSNTVICQSDPKANNSFGVTNLAASNTVFVPKNQAHTPFTMTWQSPRLNKDGTVTGTISYSATLANGKVHTANTSLTVPQRMYIGFVATTGGNYSIMSVSINSVDARRGRQPAAIHYIDSNTGQQLAPASKKWDPSTVISDVGDTLSVVAPNTSTNTSDFIAPEAPEGYTLDSISNPITIQNFPAGTPNPNIITVSYKPKPQAGIVNYKWASDVPGQNNVPGQLQAALPSKFDISADIDSPYKFSVTVPDGYVISKVKGPNGTDYTDETIPELTALEAALKENPTFVNGVNDFLITLSAKTQDVNFSVSFDNDGSQTPPDNPGTRMITQALTGAVIDDTAINATQDWFDNWVKTQAKGWRLESYVDPKGERSIDNLKASITGAGGYVLPGSNDYKAILAYNGALTFEEVPSQIDFGTHPVSTKLQTYTAKLDQSLKIADTRGKNSLSKWELTVRESSPIQEVNTKQNGISFANCLSYGNTILNNEDTLIYTADNPSDGETTVIDSSKTSPLILSVPTDKQKVDAKFSGTVTWTLSSAP